MFDTSKLSVRLSLKLCLLIVPALIGVGLLVTLRESAVVERLVMKEARTTALGSAKMYGITLDNAIDMGALTLDDVLSPVNEPIVFRRLNGVVTAVDDSKTKTKVTGELDESKATATVPPPVVGDLVNLDETRYKSKLSVYMHTHGIQAWEDSIRSAGSFIFASGIALDGFVPVTNTVQDETPRGWTDADPPGVVEANRKWDKKHSRGGRQYTEDEPLQAARFQGNENARTIVLPYTRDTGEIADDVVAQITVKGKRFGAFRIGVARDRVAEQYRDLILGLAALFFLVAVGFVGTTFIAASKYLMPLVTLTARIDQMSQCEHTSDLEEPIVSNEKTEVGRLTKSVNRLRGTLHAAMVRLDARDERDRRDPKEPANTEVRS